MAKRSLIVALAGNPNTGKSTLFNALTGLRQHVGNYPGATVELRKGTTTDSDVEFHFVDLPGTYSLAARSPDEMVSVDFILGRRAEEPRPDVVVSIVDACNLERHLYLTSQLIDLGVPIVIAVNLIDVAARQGLTIDFDRLRRQLDVPIVPIQANRHRGLNELRQAIITAASMKPAGRGATFPEAFQAEAAAIVQKLPDVEPFVAQRLLLDVGGHTERILVERFGKSVREEVQEARRRLADAGSGVPAVEARTRFAWARQALAGCVTRPAARRITFDDRLDHVLTHKVWGTLLFVALMFIVFEAIFIWASPIMGGIDAGREWLGQQVGDAMSPGPLRSLIIDGIIKGVGSVLVFLPQILILFGFIAILEDCGYMARAAFLMDRIMAKCGLNGKSFIPLLSSVACAVPGIMATRVIENRRDRLATILVAPLMSCSARLPLYMLLIGVFFSAPWWLPGAALFGLYLIGLLAAPLIALTLKRTLLRGATPVFVMEMPSFKWPQAKTVFRRMSGAGWAFIHRAGTFIFASMILVWALLYFPSSMPDGRSFEVETAKLDKELDELKRDSNTLEQDASNAELIEAKHQEIEAKQSELNLRYGEWKRQSLLGRAGKELEPAFAPLGWDWKIGMAALASFPAREVVVGTLGMIYNVGGDVDPKDVRVRGAAQSPLGKAIKENWRDEADSPRARHPNAVALSLLVFFALCCQCASTLAVIRRETGSWRWPAFTFTYMTVLAYVGALAAYQAGKLLGG